MRDFKGMKRQRNRGRGGGGGGGGKPQQHNANRAFDSNGPDGVKVRGAAQHIYEKYQQLARDASASADRVLAENYLQHAEHYFRLLRAMQPQRPVTEILGRDQFASGYDIDFEDEGQNAEEPAEVEAEGGQERQGGERPWQRDERQGGDRGEYRQRDDRPRDDRPRDEFRGRDERGPREDRGQGEYRQRDDRGQGDYRPRDDRQGGEFRPRDDRPRDDRPRDDRPRDDRPREDRPRDDRPRDDRFQGERQGRYPRDDRQGRPQGERPTREVRNDRAERPERDPLGVIEPQATPLTAQPASYEPPEGERVLRGEDGATSHAPAFLQSARPEPHPESRPEPASGDEEAAAGTRRPRRRRPPRSFEAGEAPAATEADES